MKLEIFTFCGDATAENDSLTITEAFDGIYSKSEPLKIPRCCAVYRIRFDHETESGKHTIKLSIMDQDGISLIPEFVKTIATHPRKKFGTCTNIGIIGLNGLKLPKFGEYSLDFFVDGNLLGSQPMYFQKL